MATRLHFNPLSGGLDLETLELPELDPSPAGTYQAATITLDGRGVVTAASTSPNFTDFSVLYTAAAGSNTIDLGTLEAGAVSFSDESGVTHAVALALGGNTYDLGGL